jgi:hypothetical protein
MTQRRKRGSDGRPAGEDASAIAKKLKAKRTNDSTKRQYSSRIGTMTQWMRENHSDAIDEQSDAIRLPAERNAVLAFFGHICSAASLRDEATSDVESTQAPLSFSGVTGYRSALVDLYRGAELQLDPDLNAELKTILDGYQKLLNDLKKRGLMKINEGKRHLKSSGYSMLASKLMSQTPGTSSQSWPSIVFSWSYFVVMWNLMSRSDSIDTIMLQHMEWSEDSLIIEEQGHKGDQTGSDKFGKHVYANPYEPAKCPVLAVAVLLFCYPSRPEGGRQQLFSGTDNKSRFGKMLRRVLQTLSEDEQLSLGCPAEDIGAHSLRKGSSTYSLGQVNGPNPVSVFLRMGQSLGKLKDRYIHFAEGADQLCGRMVCGLPFNDERFGVLPPHFPSALVADMNQNYWNEIVPGFFNYPRGVQCAFPFLLASVIYHEQFLRATLSACHPLFQSRLFTHNMLLERLRGSAIISIGFSSCSSLKASGIPPHLAIAAELKRVSNGMETMRMEVDALKSGFSSELPTAVATKVTDDLRQQFVIDGVMPLSIRDIDSRMGTLRDELVEEIRQARQATTKDVPQHMASNDSNWRTWNWNDGRIYHNTPPGWSFPAHTTVKRLWDLWFFCDGDTGIRPYRLISKQYDIQKAHYMRHTRAKAVVEYIAGVVTELNLLSEGTRLSNISVTASDGVFNKAFEITIHRLYGSKSTRRVEQVSYGRLYNLLCNYRRSVNAITS